MYDPRQVESFRQKYRIDPECIRRLRYGLFRMYESPEQAIRRAGLTVDNPTGDQPWLDELRIVQLVQSQSDGTQKLVVEAHDGARVETVVMRAHTGRTTACISTQVGCAAGCPFCATARMGRIRNLLASEILEQVRLAGCLARNAARRIRNVVFMGMGEPLDNEAALFEALDFLQAEQGFAFSARRLMVSTVGIPGAMIRLADRFPRVQMALSLHSARPELRARLIPWSRRHSWNDLLDALRYVAARHQRGPRQGPVMIEYLMLAGINDQMQDAEALIEYLHGVKVIVNLIPFNAVPGVGRWSATPRAERKLFAERLRSAGIFTTVRYSMGPDIRAACGQLVQQPSDQHAQPSAVVAPNIAR
jgi:23S rRNA (adenine2503-C2)-methyltransferase